MSKEIIDHVIEMKEMMAEMKARTESTNEKIDQHIDWCAKRDVKIDELEKEVSETRGSIKTIKWAIPVVSAAIAGLVKAIGLIKS